jgi:ribonuclease HII
LGNSSQAPSLVEERKLKAQGYRLVAGVDEVGRGALAGPVVAAAVILPVRIRARWITAVRDSKQLSRARRELLCRHIQETALSFGIGQTNGEEIDRHGIARATRLAMKSAIDQLTIFPEYLLIDYFRLPESPLPQSGIKYGDSICLSVACASILAKVARDAMMRELDRVYTGYGLAMHKGYGTEKHLACLRRLGPSPIHRRSFRPVREMVWQEP